MKDKSSFANCSGRGIYIYEKEREREREWEERVRRVSGRYHGYGNTIVN